MKSNWLYIRTIVAMIGSLPFALIPLGIPISLGLQAVLGTLVQCFCAYPFYLSAWKSRKRFWVNEDTLIVLGISASYLLSFYLLWSQPKRAVHFEIGSVLIASILLGRLIRTRLQQQIEKQKEGILSTQEPKTVRVKRGEKFVEISLEEMNIGSLFYVQEQEIIPVDGEMIEGSGVVDESFLSGETISVEKQPGSFVFAGSINKYGNFTAVAQKIGKDSALGQMIHFVNAAKETKISFQPTWEKISHSFIPFVLLTSMLTGLGWWLFAKNILQGIESAMAVLLMACPGILYSAISSILDMVFYKGAYQGILIKNAGSLEKALHIKHLVIDKASVICENFLKVEKAQLDEKYYYPIVKTLCDHAEHPAARSILEFVKNKSPISLQLVALRSSPGKGVSGYFDGKNYYLGSLPFLEQHNIQGEIFRAALAQEKGMIVGVATEKLALGYFVLSHCIREGSTQSIERLKKMGIETILFAEDRLEATQEVADTLDVDFYEAQVLPEQKAFYVENIKKNEGSVAYAGDGANDAAALAIADVGFAMRSGTELIMNSSDFGCINPHIQKVEQAITLSKQSIKKIKQNVSFALVYNMIGVSLAVFGFIDLMLVGGIMALSSLFVVYNATFLQKKIGNK